MTILVPNCILFMEFSGMPSSFMIARRLSIGSFDMVFINEDYLQSKLDSQNTPNANGTKFRKEICCLSNGEFFRATHD